MPKIKQVNVIGPKDDVNPRMINTTSRSGNWSRGLSPFFLGPVELWGGHVSKNMENAWQYSKVYQFQTGPDGPNKDWLEWAKAGWESSYANRYPMGKGAAPLYSWWDGQKLSYIEARKKIYCPLYAKAVEKTEAFKLLRDKYAEDKEIWLWDFDGYDHRALGMTYKDVLNCETRKMGHAFVLAMLLEEQRVWE